MTGVSTYELKKAEQRAVFSKGFAQRIYLGRENIPFTYMTVALSKPNWLVRKHSTEISTAKCYF